MSIRTIVEINHDYLRRIAKSPLEMEAFLLALASDFSHAKEMAPHGIEVLRQRHHSDKITLVIE